MLCNSKTILCNFKKNYVNLKTFMQFQIFLLNLFLRNSKRSMRKFNHFYLILLLLLLSLLLITLINFIFT